MKLTLSVLAFALPGASAVLLFMVARKVYTNFVHDPELEYA